MLIARRITILCISLSLSLSLTSTAQQKPSPLSPYVKEDAPALVLEHVRLIDGTGSAPQEDMRIDIAGGKITAVQAAGLQGLNDGQKVTYDVVMERGKAAATNLKLA